MILGYKLFRMRKDGSIGSLFIDRSARLERGVWLKARNVPTRGFAVRSGWHALPRPEAPHLSMRGRKWFSVALLGVTKVMRPKSQGGVWYLARRMKILHG